MLTRGSRPGTCLRELITQAGSGTWQHAGAEGHIGQQSVGGGGVTQKDLRQTPFTPQAWVLFGNEAGGGVSSGGSDGAGGTQAPAGTPGRPGLQEHFPGKRGGLLGGTCPL